MIEIKEPKYKNGDLLWGMKVSMVPKVCEKCGISQGIGTMAHEFILVKILSTVVDFRQFIGEEGTITQENISYNTDAGLYQEEKLYPTRVEAVVVSNTKIQGWKKK